MDACPRTARGSSGQVIGRPVFDAAIGKRQTGQRAPKAAAESCKPVDTSYPDSFSMSQQAHKSDKSLGEPTETSVSGIQGVAERPSRPPGFDMTYRPSASTFGPPLSARLPSLLYLAAACMVATLVVWGENSAPGSWAFYYVVEQDGARAMSIRTVAGLLAVGAVASTARANMRGVRIQPEGVEIRDVAYFFLPKLRLYHWAQMELIVLNMKHQVAIDLWDGRREFLPSVRDQRGLINTLEHVGQARAIPLRV